MRDLRPQNLTDVLNWGEELKRLVLTNRHAVAKGWGASDYSSLVAK